MGISASAGWGLYPQGPATRPTKGPMSPRMTLIAIGLALGGSALAALVLVMVGHRRAASLPGVSAPGVDGGLTHAVGAATRQVQRAIASTRAPQPDDAASAEAAASAPSPEPTPTPEPAWVSGALAREFLQDPILGRLEALGQEVLAAEQLSPNELLVAVYEPLRGALSNWDDETRLILYRRGPQGFERVAFVTKAGQSLPGRAAGLLLTDLDGDRLSEAFLVGLPRGAEGKVPSVGVRRQGQDQPFRVLWNRSDLGAALASTSSGRFLAYLHQDAGPNGPWTLERYGLYGGQLGVADRQEIRPDDGRIRSEDPPPAPPQPGLRWRR